LTRRSRRRKRRNRRNPLPLRGPRRRRSPPRRRRPRHRRRRRSPKRNRKRARRKRKGSPPPRKRRSPPRRKRKRRKRRRRKRSLRARRKRRSDGRGEEGEGDGGPQAEVLQDRRQPDHPGACELPEVRAGRVPRETWRPGVVRALRLYRIREEMSGGPCSQEPDRVFFFQAEDGIRYWSVTGVQTCALPISPMKVAPPTPTRSVSRRCAAASAAASDGAASTMASRVAACSWVSRTRVSATRKPIPVTDRKSVV